MSKKIAVVGECMIELSKRGAGAECGFGGDTLNTSVCAARQVDPAALTVHYATALGTNSFSQQILDAWRDEDADTSLTQRMENRLPGLYYVRTGSTSGHTFYYWRSEAAAKFRLESGRSTTVCGEPANFDCLYLSRINLAILSPTSHEKPLSLLRECHASGGKVISDNNYRPRLWASKKETQQIYQQVLECTNVAFLALDDEDALRGQQPVEDIIACIHSAGMREMVVKRGADSCLVFIAGEGLVDVPAVKLPKEKVIDTTATGGSFSASYLAVRLTGGITKDAAKRGHLTVGIAIQYRGAIIPHKAIPV